MDILKFEILETEAWSLRTKLRLIRHISSKHFRAYRHALDRWDRRQQNLFSYQPGGFAPSPVQPSGVVGQGAFFMNKPELYKNYLSCLGQLEDISQDVLNRFPVSDDLAQFELKFYDGFALMVEVRKHLESVLGD